MSIVELLNKKTIITYANVTFTNIFTNETSTLNVNTKHIFRKKTLRHICFVEWHFPEYGNDVTVVPPRDEERKDV